MAIIGALVLALVASLALGRALQADLVRSAAIMSGVADGPGFTAHGEDHRAASTTFAPGFTEIRENHRRSATVAEPGFTEIRENHRVPVAVLARSFTDYREDHRP